MQDQLGETLQCIDVTPFFHPQPQQTHGVALKWFHSLKLLVFSVTLLPLRLVIAGTCLCTVYLVSCSLKNIVYRDQLRKNTEPISGFPRTILVYTLRWACRVGLFCCGFFNIQTFGSIDEKAHCIVSNHLSYVDMILYISQFTPCFVAKASVRAVPILGTISETLQCIYTSHERSHIVSSSSGAQQIVNRQRDQYENNKHFLKLVVFPEGTTTNNNSIIHFRKGAFIGGFPVQPVVIKYTYSNFCPTWETIPPHYHFFRVLTELYHSVEIHYLPTYYPTEEEKSNPELFADNVQKIMAESIGVPATNHTIKEKLAYHKQIIAGVYRWNEPRNQISCEESSRVKENESLIPGRKNS